MLCWSSWTLAEAKAYEEPIATTVLRDKKETDLEEVPRSPPEVFPKIPTPKKWCVQICLQKGVLKAPKKPTKDFSEDQAG